MSAFTLTRISDENSITFRKITDDSIGFANQILLGMIKDADDFITQAKRIYPEIDYYHGQVLGVVGDKAEQQRTELSLKCFFWIMTNDYRSLTECQNNDPNKLSEVSFIELHMKARELFSDPKVFDAMLATMAIHDLGKVVWFKDAVLKETQEYSTDHDEVLLGALKHCPKLLPSFERLDKHYQDIITNGWEMRFSVGQFTQAENLPANLSELLNVRNSSPESLDFFLFHEILDVAGAIGHIKSNGSGVLNEQTLFTYKGAWNTVTDHRLTNEVAIYNAYLQLRGERLGLSVDDPTERACIRLCCMARMHSKEQGKLIKDQFKVFRSYDPNGTLERELNLTGLDGVTGILIYYAPQLMVNLLKRFTANPVEAISIGLDCLTNIYNLGRQDLASLKSNRKPLSLDISRLCALVNEPESDMKSLQQLKSVENTIVLEYPKL